MAYDKPKVTIDLEEYNELLSEKNRSSSDEFVLMAKKVIASFLNNRNDVKSTMADLQKQGIAFFVSAPTHSMVDKISHEHVGISKITNP